MDLPSCLGLTHTLLIFFLYFLVFSTFALTCAHSQPSISKGDNFKTEHTISCDVDIASLNFGVIFGDVVETVSDLCPSGLDVGFQIVQSFDDDEDGCAPTTLEIARVATDCCGRTTTPPLFHQLKIEVVPPRFTTEAGSIDQTLDCTANLFPSDSNPIPVPETEEGCPESENQVTVQDSSTVFDPNTCETSWTRTWTVTQDGCAATSATFLQQFTLQNDYLPEWDFFPEDIVVGFFEKYGTDDLGYPTVFQKCGASPIKVSYEDSIASGTCFAERILTRTFTAGTLLLLQVSASFKKLMPEYHLTLLSYLLLFTQWMFVGTYLSDPRRLLL